MKLSKSYFVLVVLGAITWSIQLVDTSGLTSIDEAKIVDLHNALRRQEGGANMQFMRYNKAIADLAQKWSERCVWKHGNPPFTAANGGFDGLGQNLYATTGSTLDVDSGINSWYAEKANFDYPKLSCATDKMCGHYTQEIWAATTDVGCGFTLCRPLHKNATDTWAHAFLLVCNYGPQGNIYGNGIMELPYIKGPSCTKCHSDILFCNNDLCDNKCTSPGPSCRCKAICQNGGKMNSATCRCSCADGWTGPDCTAVCKDTHHYCRHGWWKSSCSDNFVHESCPLMCGKCICRPAFSCQNGGKMNSEMCICSCEGGWTAPDCSECNVTCKNGGKLDKAKCSCSCAAGWTGADCSAECQDTHKYCNNGWFKSSCDSSTVRENCPLMCSKCVCRPKFSSCQNGGKLNSDTCICSCQGGWTGVDCSECKVSCANGGKLNDCSCSCPAGWAGQDCSAECKDLSSTCGHGWYKSSCGNSYVIEKCPLMCGKCTCVPKISCKNNGKMDSATCSCSCEGSWTGADCSECNISCKNGGKLNQDTCTCSCAPGWTGKDCSGECKDGHHYCGHGWWKSSCGTSYVHENCPLMCNKCVPAAQG